jgi:hypothetical protein
MKNDHYLRNIAHPGHWYLSGSVHETSYSFETPTHDREFHLIVRYMAPGQIIIYECNYFSSAGRRVYHRNAAYEDELWREEKRKAVRHRQRVRRFNVSSSVAETVFFLVVGIGVSC